MLATRTKTKTLYGTLFEPSKAPNANGKFKKAIFSFRLHDPDNHLFDQLNRIPTVAAGRPYEFDMRLDGLFFLAELAVQPTIDVVYSRELHASICPAGIALKEGATVVYTKDSIFRALAEILAYGLAKDLIATPAMPAVATA